MVKTNSSQHQNTRREQRKHEPVKSSVGSFFGKTEKSEDNSVNNIGLAIGIKIFLHK